MWGVGNSRQYMHHGKFTTMREAILAHSGEALSSHQNFETLLAYDRDCIIEFLKTHKVLPSSRLCRSPVLHSYRAASIRIRSENYSAHDRAKNSGNQHDIRTGSSQRIPSLRRQAVGLAEGKAPKARDARMTRSGSNHVTYWAASRFGDLRLFTVKSLASIFATS